MATSETTRTTTTDRSTDQQTTATTKTATYTVTLPAIGTIIGGKDDDPMIVANHTGQTASEYTFEEDGREKTLTEAHGSPPDDPVVETIYVEDLDHLIPGWRRQYAEREPEEFIEWLGEYCSEWGITDRNLKRYGYSKSAIHEIGETEAVDMEYPRTISHE